MTESNEQKTTRERFEEDCRSSSHKGMDFSKNERGMYKNATTRQMWEGYKLYHEKLRQRARIPEDSNFFGAPYILACLDEAGYPVTSRRPVRHKTLKRAEEEATRLTKVTGQSVSIWRLCSVEMKKEKEVEVKPSITTHVIKEHTYEDDSKERTIYLYSFQQHLPENQIDCFAVSHYNPALQSKEFFGEARFFNTRTCADDYMDSTIEYNKGIDGGEQQHHNLVSGATYEDLLLVHSNQ